MKKQSVTKKSKTDTLLQRICYAYNDLVCTLDLGFVCGELVKARVWRGWGLPNRSELENTLAVFPIKGIPREQVEVLIVVCEALFRPLKSLELELEKILPEWLGNPGGWGAPRSAEWEFLKRDFLFLWAQKESTQSSGWVLAAGAVPLPVRHRPILLAPWVVGATINRWLRLRGQSEEDSENLASRLIEELLMKPIRVQELRHWQSLLEKVLVPTEGRSVLLPAYLIEPGKLLKKDDERGWGTTIGSAWNPWTYLKNFHFPREAAQQVAKLIRKGWQSSPSLHTKKRGRTNGPSHSKLPHEVTISSDKAAFQTESLVKCMLCRSAIPLEETFRHLEATHGISKDDVTPVPTRRELRKTSTNELLIRKDTEKR